jgi:1,4-dihydroxy-2-naphthoate octaprenyltransferase/chlorophyll synthase
LKPASFPKLIVPCLLGQALGLVRAFEGNSPRTTGLGTRLGLLGVGLLFTVLDGVFIVALNDVFDEAVDGLKRRLFPTTSLKTLPDGILQRSQLLAVGWAAGAAALITAAVGETLFLRPGLTWAALGCLLVFLAYSAPPLRANYRGGGEGLEALGVGVALPWFHAFLQGGVQKPSFGVLVAPLAVLALSSALASGLSDEESDRLGGKVTFTTLLGNAAVRRGVEGCVAVGTLGLAAAMISMPWGPWRWGTLLPLGWMLLSMPRLHRLGRGATTGAFDELSRYKALLHRILWRGQGGVALVLALGSRWA